jgi:D-alanyl-D-alanine carboxypeptidase
MKGIPMDSTLEATLQRALDRWVLFGPSLGVDVTIDDALHGTWHGAGGYAEVETRSPMAVNAKCYIYSITKTFTAVRILQLAESGALSLDSPITTYLPGLPFPPGVTIRRLLNHTSGVPSYTDLPEYVPATRRSPSAPWSYDHVRELTCTGALDFDPGAGWHYSNTGYMLLAKLIETVTGRSYADEIRDGIVEPLALHETYVAQAVDDGKLTPGYARELNDEHRMEEVTRVYHPGWCLTGLIVSTTREVAQFYSKLLSGALLAPESLAQMKAHVSVGSRGGPGSFFKEPSYGLGLMVDPEFGHGGMYSHGGDGPGFNTFAMVLPDFHGRRVVLVVFCNTSIGAHPVNLFRDLLRVLPQHVTQ